MDDVTQQNAALVEQAAAAAESLEEQTQSLALTVSYFNLGQGGVSNMPLSKEKAVKSAGALNLPPPRQQTVPVKTFTAVKSKPAISDEWEEF
jgi:methyl-accepting chemotaxis protein